mgnify:CR=1 FL=1
MPSDHTLKLRIALGNSGAFLRFYGELNDFLPAAQRGRMLVHRFDVSPSIKDAIESAGVPHPEVGLIVANREPVDFSYSLQRGDYVSVYPAFHSIDLGPMPRLRESLPPPPDFVLDVHLGRLAAYLRLLGFDARYRNDFADPELASISATEQRVLLTRDRGLLKRNEVVHGYWVRHTEPRRQLLETLRRFDLSPHVNLFTRCLICNTPLIRAEKEAVAARVPPRAAEHFTDFHVCPNCERVYWKGSHYRRMLSLVGRTLREARA